MSRVQDGTQLPDVPPRATEGEDAAQEQTQQT